MNVAYYVTGHGFGHATRAIGMIMQLFDSSCSVEVVSYINNNFFEENLSQRSDKPKFKYHHRCLDIGAIQKDALHVDPFLTLQTYHDQIYQNTDALLEVEVAFLKEGKFDLVIVDASAIACKAASLAAVPCIILSNFTWDQIYEGIYNEIKDQVPSETRTMYEDMIAECSSQYCSASHYLQYPGEMAPPPGFPVSPIPLPLACRHSRLPKEAIMARYNIPPEKHVVILGFGGQKSDASWHINDSMLPENWIGLLLGATKSMLSPSKVGQIETCTKIICIPQDEYIPDLINLATCQVGKLGYGTCSEALYHGIPLIYIPRTFWPEGPPLEALLHQYNAGIRMPEEDFFGGNWEPYLSRGLNMKNVWHGELREKLQPDTAYDVIYHEIEKFLGGK